MPSREFSTRSSIRARLLSVFTFSVILILLTCGAYQVLNFRLLQAIDDARNFDGTLTKLESLQENYSQIATQLQQAVGSADIAKNYDVAKNYLTKADEDVASLQAFPQISSLHREIHTTMEQPLSSLRLPAEREALYAAFSQLNSEAQEEVNKVSLDLRGQLKLSYREIQKQRYKPLVMGLLLAGIFALLLSFVFFRVFARIKKFIGNMSAVTERAAAGELTTRALITSSDELGDVETQFNTMLSEIQKLHRELERSNRDLEDFAQMASHDLQTPLRYISAYSEMIADSKNPISATEREEFAANIRVSIKRLSNLITDLLAYSKIRAENLEHATVTVQALIDPLLLEMRGRFPLLRVHVKAPNEIHAYKSLLQTLFQNLMENTLKYARRDDVEIFVDQLGSTLTYRDNGPGIPVTDRERVFDLFHRREQDRDVAGAGIGLAICKKVMALHGGTIELLPSESGALFQMKFENTQGKNPPDEPLPPSPNSPP